MKYLIFGLTLFVLPLSACSSEPSEDDIQKAIAQTQAAQPTKTLEPSTTPAPTDTPTPTYTSIPTSTLVPLMELDLVALLVKPGDLPAGVSEAQVRDTKPNHAMYESVPKSDNITFQQFAKHDDEAGGVVVFVFESLESVEKGFSAINMFIEGKVDDTVGEKSAYNTNSILLMMRKETYTDLIFVRCHALVGITIPGWPDDAIAYAKRIDSRLEALVCRE